MNIKLIIDTAFDLAIKEAASTNHPLLVSMLTVAKNIFDSFVAPQLPAAQAKVQGGC